MDDEEFDSEHCLLVKIDPPLSEEDAQVEGDEDFNCLEMYMENIAKDIVKSYKFNGTRSYAIVMFEKPISGVNRVQKKCDEKPLLGVYKVTLKTIPRVDKVLVTDPSSALLESFDDSHDLKDCDLVLYFENEKFCPAGGEVKDLKVLSCHHAAVVEFVDHSVVRKLTGDHKLGESHFTVRPLNIFEFVEGPCCSVCSKDNGADDIAEDTTQESWHSTYEDNGSQKKETQSGSQSNSDMDEDVDTLQKWPENEDTHRKSQSEHSSFTGGNCSSLKFAAPDDSEITQLLVKTIRFKRIPGLIPEEYDMINLTKSTFEILEDDKKKKDHIKKVTEDVRGFGEVDLAEYTVVARKLNGNDGRKWISELLDDLKIPAVLKHNKSTLTLRAINVELAEEAAKTVTSSLLPAKIKCDQSKMSKCLKVLHGKTIISGPCKPGYLELLGIPMDVIRAVGEIEKLHSRCW